MAEAYANACSGKKKPGTEDMPAVGKSRKVVQETPEEAFCNRLALRVRHTYVTERSSYESLVVAFGGKKRNRAYRPSKRHDGGANWDVQAGEYPEGTIYESVWQKIAVSLFRDKIDPVFYVQRIFAVISSRYENPPTPEQLLSERYRRIYAESLEDSEHELALALMIQSNLAKNQILLAQIDGGVSMEEAVEEVLVNDRLALSSLFRYCLAASMRSKRFRRYMENYRVGAAVQYLRQAEDYDEGWGEFVPNELRDKAESIYHRVQDLLAEESV